MIPQSISNIDQHLMYEHCTFHIISLPDTSHLGRVSLEKLRQILQKELHRILGLEAKEQVATHLWTSSCKSQANVVGIVVLKVS